MPMVKYDQVTRRQGRIVLQRLDKEMCHYFGYRRSSWWWLNDWYNSVGFLLDIGFSYDQVRRVLWAHIEKDLEDPELLEWHDLTLRIVDYIEEKYPTYISYPRMAVDHTRPFC